MVEDLRAALRTRSPTARPFLLLHSVAGGSKSLACRADSESAVRLADLCVGERPDTSAMGGGGR